MPPTDTTYRPHIYGSDAPTPQGHMMQTCSRCGQTRAEVTLPGIGKRMFYRLQPDGRAFEHELACSRLEKLLALARSPAAGESEAQSAAIGALQLLVHQRLVFHPEPPLLTNALARYHAVTDEGPRRTAALDVVRASQGAILVLEHERQALRQQAPPPRRAEDTQRATPGQQAMRIGRDFLSALFNSVELPDGSTVGQRREQIAEDVRAIEEDLDTLREQIGLGRRKNPAPAKPKKPSKKKRAPAKTTRPATKKKSGKRSAKKGKGAR